MALFNKIFTSRQFEAPCDELRDCTRFIKANPEDVRLLLFKESDWRGRKLLFDSSGLKKYPIQENSSGTSYVNSNGETCIIEVFGGYEYQYTGPAADSNALGEMIFGAVSMNCKSFSFKIHVLEEPFKLLCSKVFPCIPPNKKTSRNSQNTESKCLNTSISKSFDISHNEKDKMTFNFSFNHCDSGFYCETSPSSSVSSYYDYSPILDAWQDVCAQEDASFNTPSSSRKLSACSTNSLYRRTRRNTSTKFDLGYHSANHLSVPSTNNGTTSCDSQVYSVGSATTDSLSSNQCSTGGQNRTKMGLAILLCLTNKAEDRGELSAWCVRHCSQLEALLGRVRALLLAPRRPLLVSMHRAHQHVHTWLSDLKSGARLGSVWQQLGGAGGGEAARAAADLLRDLCHVLSAGDAKHTNFFISTLLTHVLTYHLGWVSSVSPYEVQSEPHERSCEGRTQPPYNALWAQYSDLVGCIAHPPKSARTILCGTNPQFINKLLVVLTYFIRCGEVHKIKHEIDSNNFSNDLLKLNSEASDWTMEKECSITSDIVNECKSISAEHAKVMSDMLSNTLNSNSYKSLSPSVCSDVMKPMSSKLKKTKSVIPQLPSPQECCDDSDFADVVSNQKPVLFVLGENEKLIGLKSKCFDCVDVKQPLQNGTTSLAEDARLKEQFLEKHSLELKLDNSNFKVTHLKELEGTKVETESASKARKNVIIDSESQEDLIEASRENQELNNEIESEVEKVGKMKSSRCCEQQNQHSKPIKHSGFKFEFDKYPQIVTNYMKSKNLEILDRLYIGKPGNLKVDSYLFDPTFVPPIPDEKFEICLRCQLNESSLETPTNASELEFMSDMPGQSDLQYAQEKIVEVDTSEDPIANTVPKTFVRKKQENTVVVNVVNSSKEKNKENPRKNKNLDRCTTQNVKTRLKKVNIDIPRVLAESKSIPSGYHYSLFGGLTDHYIPDLVLQGILAAPDTFEQELKRDLDIACQGNEVFDEPIQAVAIVADSSSWAVRVVGGAGAGAGAGAGMSALVSGMLDALPHMWRARVPAAQCLFFIESKLREFCVLSKTLAEILLSSEVCDMEALTRALNVDVNDVPLLLAVAGTHSPQLARRYGVAYK